MNVVINNKNINVVIKRKKNNKRTYLRINKDLDIYITTNFFTSEKNIIKLIDDNKEFIIKNIQKEEQRKKYNDNFYYLGKKYDIVYLNSNDIVLGNDKIFINRNTDINKWLKQKACIIFQNELDNIYNIFPYSIPYPSLTIRIMKTRWGVCNVKTKRVTLNLNLIKRNIKYLDYVIIHELSHLVYPNHSKDFWNLVSIMEPNYKQLRKEMNNYE